MKELDKKHAPGVSGGEWSPGPYDIGEIIPAVPIPGPFPGPGPILPPSPLPGPDPDIRDV